MLSAILLKRWIHFFCQSLGECSPSVASSDPSSLFVVVSVYIGVNIWYHGLRSIRYCL
jgi:hypothetical protein